MDIYEKKIITSPNIVAQLGPLAPLAGHWEGNEGIDTSPARDGEVKTLYRERLTLDPMGPVQNGPQMLFGLRYATTVWPLDTDDPFHEEVGYWLWDPDAEMVMRCFIVPRGITVLAGGKAAADASEFEMLAEVESDTFGIASNPFLDLAFKTVRYELKITVNDDGSFYYFEDTQLRIAERDGIFHHTDENRLMRIG